MTPSNNLVSMNKQPDCENTFKQIMDIWITPEIIRRQQSGSIPRPYDLQAAQIIFHVDGRPNEIRLNKEVRSIAKVKLKDGTSKKNKGDSVYTHEVESYESFRLPDDEDQNCGHITLHRFGDQWTIVFDCIYNKGIAAKHLSVARQFLTSAQQALTTNSMPVFVDNCFSAAELTAKALLLTILLSGENTINSHNPIHSQYNFQAKLGNVEASHKDAFNRLKALRPSARYLKNALDLSESEAKTLIQTVEDAISFVDHHVQIEKP